LNISIKKLMESHPLISKMQPTYRNLRHPVNAQMTHNPIFNAQIIQVMKINMNHRRELRRAQWQAQWQDLAAKKGNKCRKTSQDFLESGFGYWVGHSN
jgi:hypothetical protein